MSKEKKQAPNANPGTSADDTDEIASEVSTALATRKLDESGIASIFGTMGLPGAGSWQSVADDLPDLGWHPEAGGVIAGILRSRIEIPTRFGPCTMAVFETVKTPEPISCRTRDGEITTANPGDLVSVIETHRLKTGLANAIGLPVVIACDGKRQTKKGFNVWAFRCFVRVPEQTALARG